MKQLSARTLLDIHAFLRRIANASATDRLKDLPEAQIEARRLQIAIEAEFEAQS